MENIGWQECQSNEISYNQRSSKEFVERYESQPHLVYGLTNFPYTYIAEKYPKQITFDSSQMRIVTIDIEVECENGFPNAGHLEPMLSITIKNHDTGRIKVWGLHEYSNDREDVQYIQCQNERELLAQFLAWWESDYPDIITGWNTEFFDIPYLCNRIKSVMGEDAMKRLSPWGVVVLSYG